MQSFPPQDVLVLPGRITAHTAAMDGRCTLVGHADGRVQLLPQRRACDDAARQPDSTLLELALPEGPILSLTCLPATTQLPQPGIACVVAAATPRAVYLLYGVSNGVVDASVASLVLHSKGDLVGGTAGTLTAASLSLAPACSHVALLAHNGPVHVFELPSLPRPAAAAAEPFPSQVPAATPAAVTPAACVAMTSILVLGSSEHDALLGPAHARTGSIASGARLHWQLQQGLLPGDRPGRPRRATGFYLYWNNTPTLFRFETLSTAPAHPLATKAAVTPPPQPVPPAAPPQKAAAKAAPVPATTVDLVAAPHSASSLRPCQRWQLPHAITAGAMSDGAKRLVIGTAAGCVHVWDVKHSLLTHTSTRAPYPICSVAFVDGAPTNILVTAGVGYVGMFDVERSQLHALGPPLHITLQSVTFPTSAPVALARTACGSLVLYSLTTSTCVADLTAAVGHRCACPATIVRAACTSARAALTSSFISRATCRGAAMQGLPVAGLWRTKRWPQFCMRVLLLLSSSVRTREEKALFTILIQGMHVCRWCHLPPQLSEGSAGGEADSDKSIQQPAFFVMVRSKPLHSACICLEACPGY